MDAPVPLDEGASSSAVFQEKALERHSKMRYA